MNISTNLAIYLNISAASIRTANGPPVNAVGTLVSSRCRVPLLLLVASGLPLVRPSLELRAKLTSQLGSRDLIQVKNEPNPVEVFRLPLSHVFCWSWSNGPLHRLGESLSGGTPHLFGSFEQVSPLAHSLGVITRPTPSCRAQAHSV